MQPKNREPPRIERRRKRYEHRFTNSIALLNIESSLDDENLSLMIENARKDESFTKKEPKPAQNQHFYKPRRVTQSSAQYPVTPANLDYKLLSSTTYLNLKSPINFNMRRLEQFKLPKLSPEQSVQNEYIKQPIEEHQKRRDAFNISKISPRNKYNINDLTHITQHLIRSDSSSQVDLKSTKSEIFSLPDLKSQKLDTSLKYEESYLYDKTKVVHKNLFDIPKRPARDRNENESSNLNENSHLSLPKPKLQLFFNKINMKRREAKAATSSEELNSLVNDANTVGSNFESNLEFDESYKRVYNTPESNPSAKFSKVDDKVYLEIYMPSFY